MYAKLLISQTFFNIYFIEVHINQHLKGLVHIVDFIFVPARNTPVFINGHDDIITIPRFIRTKDAGDIIIVYALDKLIIGRSKFVYPVIAYFVMNRCRSALRPVDNYPPRVYVDNNAPSTAFAKWHRWGICIVLPPIDFAILPIPYTSINSKKSNIHFL